MSTFLLIILGRFFGGFGFWWTDELATRFDAAAEAQAVSGAGAVLVVYARSAEPQDDDPEPKPHERIWTDDDEKISNGF